MGNPVQITLSKKTPLSLRPSFEIFSRGARARSAGTGKKTVDVGGLCNQPSDPLKRCLLHFASPLPSPSLSSSSRPCMQVLAAPCALARLRTRPATRAAPPRPRRSCPPRGPAASSPQARPRAGAAAAAAMAAMAPVLMPPRSVPVSAITRTKVAEVVRN